MIDYQILLPKIHYFLWIGTIYLIFLTYKDYKDKMRIDDRHNFIMIGIAISLLSHIQTSFIKLLAITITIILLGIYLNKFKLIGGADITAIRWILLGLGIIDYTILLWFTGFFVIIALFYALIKRYLFHYKGHTPFFIVLLISFWFTGFIFKLY